MGLIRSVPSPATAIFPYPDIRMTGFGWDIPDRRLTARGSIFFPMKKTTTLTETDVTKRREDSREVWGRLELFQVDLDGLPGSYETTREGSVYEMPGLGWRYG